MASCSDTDDTEEHRDPGLSTSEPTEFTEEQDAPLSAADITLHTTPVREETEEGRFQAVLLGDLWLPRRDPSGMMRRCHRKWKPLCRFEAET